MTPTLAVEVMKLARLGLGHEDIIVKLRPWLNEADKREVRSYVLALASKVAKRYGT